MLFWTKMEFGPKCNFISGPNIKNGKWMNLLNNKYSKFKSELNIKLALEEENGDLVNNINQESGMNKGGKLNVEKRELDGKPFLQVGKGMFYVRKSHYVIVILSHYVITILSHYVIATLRSLRNDLADVRT